MTFSVNYEIEKFEASRCLEADWTKCLALEQESFIDPWSAALFKETVDQERTHMFLLRDLVKNEICGFACYSTVCDEAELLQICVATTHRKRGLGLVLLKKSLSELKAQNFSHFFLEVRASNLTATNLYRKVGFKEDGIRRGYYRAIGDSPCEDALVMSLHE